MKNLFFLTVILICFQVFGVAQNVTAVQAVCITVNDLESSVHFYTDVLGFVRLNTEEAWGLEQETLFGKFGIHYRVAHLRLGEQLVDLIDYLTAGGRPITVTQKANDLEFQHIAIVVSDMDKAFAILRKNNVEFVSTNPQTLPISNTAAAGIKAFYFHDNDKHNLELIWFPNGKGDPKWQQHNDKIFLGIDHTAIGIRNTDSSLHFWNELLSFQKKGESHNVGAEQAHLNNVKGAELKITGLRAMQGFGVEFLQYLSPGPGRDFPSDTQCDDLWNWLTKVKAKDIRATYDLLHQNHTAFISENMVTINGVEQFIVRDPDGHAIWFTAK
jgi:catechol 2,3-dioxygenase-like lactoylglutathione lyase family enzyme